MNLEKLMIEDIIDSDTYLEYDKYKVYPMDELEEQLELMNDAGEEKPFNINFHLKDDWFIKDKDIVSLTNEELNIFLKDNKQNLMDVYDELAEGNNLYNKIEVINETLKDFVIELSNEELKEYKILYSDVNLESIADYLHELKLNQIIPNFGYYGSYSVTLTSGSYHLIEF